MRAPAGSPELPVALVAGFGAPNYGDLLYAVVMRALVAERAAVEFYGLPSRRATPAVPMRRLARLYRDRVRGVLVGGGDILRADWSVVARDHLGRTFTGRGARHRSRVEARWYAHRELRLPSPGPFLVDPLQLDGAPPVAYVSCAVPGPVPGAVSESFVRVLERSAYLGVRDERSRELLVQAGVDPGRLEVAPDSVLTLPRIWPGERLTPVGAQVLREAGIRAEDEPLVFQVAPWLVGDRAEVVALLQRSAELGRRVVGLAMGSYSGEHELIADLVRDVKGAVMLPVLDVERTAAVIAASSGVVTSSFHAGITAGVYGRTVAFLPGAERKALGLMAALDAEPSTYIARSWADGLLLEGQAFDASAVVRAADSAARAVDAAVDRVLA